MASAPRDALGRKTRDGAKIGAKEKDTTPGWYSRRRNGHTFSDGGEHWNEYLVEDGSIIRTKLVATEVIKVDGKYDEQGNPLYVLHSTQVLWVDSPDDLRREEGEGKPNRGSAKEGPAPVAEPAEQL